MYVKVLRKKYQHLKEVNSETGQSGIVAEYAVNVGCTCTHKHTQHLAAHAHTLICGRYTVHVFATFTHTSLMHLFNSCTCRVVAVSGGGTVFIMLHPLVQKLESLLLIDKAWLVSGHCRPTHTRTGARMSCHVSVPAPLPPGLSLSVPVLGHVHSIMEYSPIMSVVHMKLFVHFQ